MGGGPESRCVGRVYSLDGVVLMSPVCWSCEDGIRYAVMQSAHVMQTNVISQFVKSALFLLHVNMLLDIEHHI